MPVEIKVAPPVITISQGRTFMVTDLRGEIDPQTDQGVYAIDTRFISSYRLYINREPWVLDNSSQIAFYSSRAYLTNPKINTIDGDIEANTIGLTLDRTVDEGIHEDFYIDNYTGKKVRLFLQLELRSDFADIFEVKAKHVVPRGRILHEIRFGELAHFHVIPHTPYYGTADATILYLLVLSETFRWTGDINLLKKFRKAAEACLDWIDHYGDLDGDGFQEYKTYSSLGYENVGWKDAWDAVVYPDGTLVPQPKALCELQDYVYDAKVRMAEIFEVLGDPARAQALLQQAETLKQKFNAVFWMEVEGCFAYGLDPQKKLITTIASNAGHCLWSGIADPDKGKRTARRLIQDDMWSGWGIRTITSKNPAYNPFSYHLGSVWPHDNSIISAGIKRYEPPDEANVVIHSVLDAARRFEAYRLPEVYAGVKRKGADDFPALYPPGANIPQGWAAASIFQMLQTILGLRADAPHKRLYVHPTLPRWLEDLEFQHLRVGPCFFTLHFWREGDLSRWEVVDMMLNPGVPYEEAIEVVDEP